jgi:hypothetical protein
MRSKIWLVVIFVALFVAGSGWATEIETSKKLFTDDVRFEQEVRVIRDLLVDSGVLFEGSSSDLYETRINVRDPAASERDVTFYAPSSPYGNMDTWGVVLHHGIQQKHTSAATTHVTSTTLNIPSGWFTDGRLVTWEIIGTLINGDSTDFILLADSNNTSTNTNMNSCAVTLKYTDGADGDFRALFGMYAFSNTATQKLWVDVNLDVSSGTVALGQRHKRFDYRKVYTDFEDGAVAPCMIAIRTGTGNSCTVEYVRVETTQ